MQPFLAARCAALCRVVPALHGRADAIAVQIGQTWGTTQQKQPLPLELKLEPKWLVVSVVLLWLVEVLELLRKSSLSSLVV